MTKLSLSVLLLASLVSGTVLVVLLTTAPSAVVNDPQTPQLVLQLQLQQLRRRSLTGSSSSSSSSSNSIDPKTVETKIGSCLVKESVKFKSQDREDEIIYNTFYYDGANPKKKQCEGLVIEMGGFKGKVFSNSWFFEFALGWKTILMEADSENFQQMTINRPDAINLFGAMCFGDSASFQPGSLSKATGGVLTDMSDQFKEKWVDSAAPAARRPVVKVPCMQVSQVLQEYDIAHVDVFFLDVEGGELTVLQTIDFDAGIQFDMFVVEMDNTDPTKDETIRAMLQSRGYISPFSMRKECEKKQPNCRTSELFVLEKVWRERDHQRG